jgi:hypothetical protein
MSWTVLLGRFLLETLLIGPYVCVMLRSCLRPKSSELMSHVTFLSTLRTLSRKVMNAEPSSG